MATLLLGAPIAKQMLEKLKRKGFKRNLCLAVIQVGKHEASETYLREKQRACEYAGIRFKAHRFLQGMPTERLKKEIRTIAKKRSTTGLIVQLPLPSHLDAQEICDAIPLEKDADVLSSASFGLFALGRLPFLPPTVGAVQALLQKHDISVAGKRILLVGSRRLIGFPLAVWLMRQKATLTIANSTTRNLPRLAKEADIIISGVGKPGLITGSMIKKGAVVIDEGTSVEQGLTKGDVDGESVSEKAKFLAPVPGGVGPLTVACLLRNLAILAKQDG